jgi:hypothetical protein
MVPAGRRDDGQHFGIHGLRHRRRPGQRENRGVEAGDPVPQPDREHLLKLGQRPQAYLFQPGHAAVRGRMKADRNRYRFFVVQQQRWQYGAGVKPVAPHHSRCGVHGVTQLAQPLHVTPDGTQADAQPFREFAAGPVSPGLQERQQAEQAGRSFQHVVELSGLLVTIADSNHLYRLTYD